MRIANGSVAGPVFDHLYRMTDGRGLFEHARHNDPRQPVAALARRRVQVRLGDRLGQRLILDRPLPGIGCVVAVRLAGSVLAGSVRDAFGSELGPALAVVAHAIQRVADHVLVFVFPRV
jgi:hypothetical protein